MGKVGRLEGRLPGRKGTRGDGKSVEKKHQRGVIDADRSIIEGARGGDAYRAR